MSRSTGRSGTPGRSRGCCRAGEAGVSLSRRRAVAPPAAQVDGPEPRLPMASRTTFLRDRPPAPRRAWRARSGSRGAAASPREDAPTSPPSSSVPRRGAGGAVGEPAPPASTHRFPDIPGSGRWGRRGRPVSASISAELCSTLLRSNPGAISAFRSSTALSSSFSTLSGLSPDSGPVAVRRRAPRCVLGLVRPRHGNRLRSRPGRERAPATQATTPRRPSGEAPPHHSPHGGHAAVPHELHAPRAHASSRA